MRKPVQWVAVLAALGLLAGGVFGYLTARTIGCVVDGVDLPASSTCYRVLGLSLSGSTYYTAAAAAIGAGIGVALGLFLVTPILLWRTQDPETRMHPLEHPLVWVGFQLVELFLLIPALLFWLPDPGEWPEAARVAVWLGALLSVTAINYAIRRRFIPR